MVATAGKAWTIACGWPLISVTAQLPQNFFLGARVPTLPANNAPPSVVVSDDNANRR
jgi:hypothetical protein